MKKNDYGTHPFSTVTAGTVLRKARFRAYKQIIINILIIAAVAFLSIAMCWDAMNPFRLINLLILILLAPAGLLAIYFPYHSMRKAYRSLYAMSGEKETVSPHGSAEQIAEVLRDPENVRLLNSSTVILTRSYLMLKNDFTTYLPLTEIVRAQVETHYSSRCSGIDIKATDTFGRTCVFDMGALPYVTDISAYRNEIAQTLKETLAAYAPDAKFLR